MARRGKKGWHISRPKQKSRKYHHRSNQWQYPRIRRGRYSLGNIRQGGVQFTYRNRSRRS